MGFLKRLFGGGSQLTDADKDGMYYYFRANRSGEVIQLRLNRFNDLSQMDDESGYFARKVIVGAKSFERMEAEFVFDRNRRLVSCEVSGGDMVDREDYLVYRNEQAEED